MPDITMCAGQQFLPAGPQGQMIAVTCYRKDTCERHTAQANPHRQSWFAKIPVHVVYNQAGEQTQQCDNLVFNDKLFTLATSHGGQS